MADTTDLLKRLEEIAWMHRDGYMCASSCDTCWLLKLTRALLESQGELIEDVRGHACCRAPHNPCSACNAIAHAERIRKGEV